mmetsp:Transcript_144911/g.263478  ORF Transcript_144911/g.263478 Transcript_144911/m.263478 type:complete len:315 (-) Transcript_144911:2063-3007(-)
MTVTVPKKSFSQPSIVIRMEMTPLSLVVNGGSKMISWPMSSIFTSKRGSISCLAIISGSKISHKYCRDTAIEDTKPSITMLFTKSTYAFHVSATFETFRASLESLTNLWISLPPSVMFIILIPTRSLCFVSKSSIGIGFAPFLRSMMGSLHHVDKICEILLRLLLICSTTPDTSLTIFIVVSMNSGILSSVFHFRSVRPGDRTWSILVMRSSSSGSSTGKSSVRTALYICTIWSSWACHSRKVSTRLYISSAACGTSMSKRRKKRTSRSSLVRAASKFTLSKPVFSCRLRSRIFSFSLAASTESALHSEKRCSS